MSISRLQLIVADITTLEVDAIVNAANVRLMAGAGVDGAIHRAAGPGLQSECDSIAEVRPGVRCPTGEARITSGHGLAAKWVIHTVGPVWGGGERGERDLLASCYRSCLTYSASRGVGSIAFPAISTGIYGFPKTEAARIAVGEVRAWIEVNEHPKRVLFCCFSDDDAGHYRAVMGESGTTDERR